MDRFEDFLMGVVAMGHFVAGLFFLRFWRTTRERLFVMFAIAFWVLGAIRLAMIWINDPIEHNHYLYWLRFVAYVLILLAIVDKNRQR
jgi:hypothetical protein